MDWKSLALPLLVTASSICFVDGLMGECPSPYNYAFYDGSYCCHYPEEANATLVVYGNKPVLVKDNPSCDGGTLGLDSRCCKGGLWIPCPLGKEKCRSTVRETCLVATNFVNENYKQVSVGVPSRQFRDECLEVARLSKRGKARIVREKYFSDGIKSGWSPTHVCSYLEGGQKWSCTIFFASGGSENVMLVPTAGVSRSLSSPGGEGQCIWPRRWIRVRGKLRCRLRKVQPKEGLTKTGTDPRK